LSFPDRVRVPATC